MPQPRCVAGHSDAQALNALAVVLQDFAQIIDSAETGSLGTEDGTAGADSLTGHSTELGSADDAAILAVQITDLAAADTNVTSGAVDVLTDVTMELGHEAWQKRMTSPSLRPMGEKSEPPLAPPMAGRSEHP